VRSVVRALEVARGAAVALALLTACGSPTKEDLLEKARGVSTRAALEKALGKPTEISKLGPVEQWTYRASNGELVFVLVGDTVTLEAARGPAPK